MKDKIHPAYYPKAKVTCACGNVFAVGSTQEKIEVEICSACHPFFTGEQKLIDTAGRVEKFKARSASAKVLADKRVVAIKKKGVKERVKIEKKHKQKTAK